MEYVAIVLSIICFIDNYLIQKRFDKLIDELNIELDRIEEVGF